MSNEVSPDSEKENLYINGINGVTGEYLIPPLKFREVVGLIKKEATDPAQQEQESWLTRVWRSISQPHLGLPLDVDPANVAEAGWGIVFHKDEDPAVKKALEPLVEHRRRQVGNDLKLKEFDYRDGESRAKWLARHGVGAGSINPTKVPYYLLLVGSPERIPFSFGYLLDVEYGVGRLQFDTAEEYATYAASLIEYETSATLPNGKEAVFFAPRHAFDMATQLSADHLVTPLVEGFPDGTTNVVQGVAERWGYESRKVVGAGATKAAFGEILRSQGKKSPAFLFTASHGMGWPKGHANQLAAQGALLCQDWPGFGKIKPDHYFAASDVPPDARLQGMINFHFACYGAGTPSTDRFIHEPGKPPPAIADQSFIAALPRTLLTHAGGGTLATIGHVERAWGYSITTTGAGPQLIPFQNAIGRILIGQPLGYAMKDFDERYAALSTVLSGLLEEVGFGAVISDYDLATAWIERNDAESYIVVGDPAVRLRVDVLE